MAAAAFFGYKAVLERLPMRRLLRRGVTLTAIYAVALHFILLGFAPIGASAASVDPFTAICHSAAGDLDDKAPSKSALIPGRACEHCNLCSVVAPPPAPDVALVVELGPARILDVVAPASAAPRTGKTSDPKLARGPPRFV